MKNSIRKRYYKPKSSIKSDSVLLYNISFIATLLEILIGAILGIALCFGFIFSFFMLKGSLLVSIALFCVIMILAIFLVLLFKYIFLSIVLRIKEIEVLEKIYLKT